MMDEQKIERMFQLAKRVADKSELSEPLFSFRQFDPEDDCYPRNMVAVLTEGRLRNQLFASWIPITEEAYNDPTVRSAMVSRLQDFWRFECDARSFAIGFTARAKRKAASVNVSQTNLI